MQQPDITEWAHAELRIQSLSSRISRMLSEQGLTGLEQALVDLAVIHLNRLEDGPLYSAILGEMNRILASSLVSKAVSPVEEFFGLARRTISLPKAPPAGPEEPESDEGCRHCRGKVFAPWNHCEHCQ